MARRRVAAAAARGAAAVVELRRRRVCSGGALAAPLLPISGGAHLPCFSLAGFSSRAGGETEAGSGGAGSSLAGSVPYLGASRSRGDDVSRRPFRGPRSSLCLRRRRQGEEGETATDSRLEEIVEL
jgi:hypothetical protein